MKKLVILFLLYSIYMPTVFADISKCKNVNSIHCVYYVGNKSKTNRYVKVTYNSISHTHCTKADSFDFIPQQFSKNWAKVNKQVFIYDQCSDATCKNTVHLGTDNFTITKNGKKYTSNPRIFKVHLLNYGKSCVHDSLLVKAMIKINLSISSQAPQL